MSVEIVNLDEVKQQQWNRENGNLLSCDFQIQNILMSNAAQEFTGDLTFSVSMNKGKVIGLKLGCFQEASL